MFSVIKCAAPGVLALGLLGCGQQPLEVAPSGAAPAIETAVGPIPGGGEAPPVRSNPFAGNQTAASEGHKLFGWYNCSGCHGVYGGGGMGPNLRDPVWIYGGSPDEVYASISEGRANGMPSWAMKIPEEQIWKIVTYIGTLNTPSEIDPPDLALVVQQEHGTGPSIAPPTTPPHGAKQ
ncbi:MAG TPA: c-type cytochrome [Bryobacteraceae bacterium]|nr:c-type cytochrome [Bryobacteraceae bacterium]